MAHRYFWRPVKKRRNRAPLSKASSLFPSSIAAFAATHLEWFAIQLRSYSSIVLRFRQFKLAAASVLGGVAVQRGERDV